jgi:hypothetical protein
MLPTVASISQSTAEVATTESFRARLDRMLDQMAATGQSAEAIDIARKRYERYLTTTPVPTTVSTTYTSYSTSTSTSSTPMYKVSTDVVTDMLNTTMSFVSENISKVGKAVTEGISTVIPKSSTTSAPVTIKSTRLYTDFSSTLSPLNGTSTTVHKYVRRFTKAFTTTTEVTTTGAKELEGGNWARTVPDYCKLLQQQLLEWVSSGTTTETSSSGLLTTALVEPVVTERAVFAGEAVMGNSSTSPVHDDWGDLPLEGAPLYPILAILGVCTLGKIDLYLTALG